MFVYWGATNSGKWHAIQHCHVNDSPYSMLSNNTIDVRTNIRSNDLNTEYDRKLYAKKNTCRYETIKEEKRSFSFESAAKKHGVEYYPQIDKSRRITNQRRENHEDLTKYTGTYESPFSLKSIGLDKTNIILQYSRVAFNNKILNQLKNFNHINIIPYRVINSVDPLVSKIQMWSPSKYNYEYENVFDCYTKNKDLVMKYLAEFYEEQRDIELLLKQNNVKYEYYDMDTYDLASITGLSKNPSLPNCSDGYKLWNLNDTDTKKRFDKAVDICEEFLKVTGLTDTRLDFRAKDGI